MPTDSDTATKEKQAAEAASAEVINFCRDAITEHYGDKCAEFDPGCHCCLVWRAFEALVADKALLDSGCIHTGPKEAGTIHSGLYLRERINMALSGCMDM